MLPVQLKMLPSFRVLRVSKTRGVFETGLLAAARSLEARLKTAPAQMLPPSPPSVLGWSFPERAWSLAVTNQYLVRQRPLEFLCGPVPTEV